VELAAGDEREEIGGSLGVIVGAEKEPCFSSGGHWSERIFARVVVHAQPALFEEAAQASLLANGVTERLLDRICSGVGLSA
jgi:hypothetical protein